MGATRFSLTKLAEVIHVMSIEFLLGKCYDLSYAGCTDVFKFGETLDTHTALVRLLYAYISFEFTIDSCHRVVLFSFSGN